MIKRITIEQLYGIYDYNIHIPENQRVTIITGPNGYGKTTILKAINHLLACNFWYFYLLKFTSFDIYFRNGIQIRIKRDTLTLSENESEREDTASTTKESVTFQFLDDSEKVIESFEINETDFLGWERRGFRLSLNRTREIEDIDKEELFGEEFNINNDSILLEKSRNIRIFMQEYSYSFIKEQRLTKPVVQEGNRKIAKIEFLVEGIANELIQNFSKAQQDFAMTSQRIDASFIRRLAREEHELFSEYLFRQKLENLKKKMNDYRKYGLVPQTDILEVYPAELQKVLSLYINDMDKKISSYDSFYTQLSIFDKFITSKQLSNKEIRLDDKKGIAIYDKHENEIPLSKLSSGEQNLIILYYKLSFGLNNRSLLLIDEPENSLHIAWQRQMLDDYIEMANELKCQVFIATHSPAFINGKWNIAFDLFENKYQEQ